MNECNTFHAFCICSVPHKLSLQVNIPSQPFSKYTSVLTFQLHYLLFLQKSPSGSFQELSPTEDLITAVLFSRSTPKSISRKDKLHKIIWPKVAYHCLQHLQKQLHHLTTTNQKEHLITLSPYVNTNIMHHHTSRHHTSTSSYNTIIIHHNINITHHHKLQHHHHHQTSILCITSDLAKAHQGLITKAFTISANDLK